MSTAGTQRAVKALGEANEVGPTVRVGTALKLVSDIRPEPRGPRSVCLALARLGLVVGTDLEPSLVTGQPDPILRNALRALIAERAIARDASIGTYRLTEYGEALHGPDLRQRGFHTVR